MPESRSGAFIARRATAAIMSSAAAILRGFAFDGHVNWFPGHMAKALRQMQQRVAAVTTSLV